MSYPEIGRHLGKNHSSAVQAVQKMEAIIEAQEHLTWLTSVGPRAMPASRVVHLLTEQIQQR
jgi:hypothetical protein